MHLAAQEVNTFSLLMPGSIQRDKLASGGVSDWFPPFYQRVSEWENLHIKETCKKHLKRFSSSLGSANESEDIK
ncbi:hypothetical protein ACI3LX_002909 [Candidozyma auris]